MFGPQVSVLITYGDDSTVYPPSPVTAYLPQELLYQETTSDSPSFVFPSGVFLLLCRFIQTSGYVSVSFNSSFIEIYSSIQRVSNILFDPKFFNGS